MAAYYRDNNWYSSDRSISRLPHMPLRKLHYVLICILFVLSIFAGCTSSTDHKTSGSTLENDIELANKIIPDEIPGFVLRSKVKDPMSGTLYGDEYTAHAYYEPVKGSKYDGLVEALSVDIMVYSDAETAQKWYSEVWGKISDESILIGTKDGVYRYENGEAVITFMDENLIINSYSLYFIQFPDLYHEEGITKDAAMAGASRAIENLNRHS